MTDLAKPDELTAKMWNFALRYIALDGDGPAAYRATYNAEKMKPASVQSAVRQLLTDPRVAAFIAELEDRKAQAVMDGVIVTEQMIVNLLWQIATADPNELIAYRVGCCRHCHGTEHHYQWIDAIEWADAIQKETDDAAILKRPAKDVPIAGGFGFNRTLPPHDDCPRCFGQGVGDVVVTDTNNLTGNAKRLYAGVKVTRDGIEVKMRDQDKALDTLATYAGLRKDKGDGAARVNMFFGRVTRTIIDPAAEAKTIEGPKK